MYGVIMYGVIMYGVIMYGVIMYGVIKYKGINVFVQSSMCVCAIICVCVGQSNRWPWAHHIRNCGLGPIISESWLRAHHNSRTEGAGGRTADPSQSVWWGGKARSHAAPVPPTSER
jgi:hypothetical protein